MSDLEAMIQRHLDGVAPPDEVAELSARLEADGAARATYLGLAQVHASLAAADDDGPFGVGYPQRAGRPARRLALVGLAAAVIVAAAAALLWPRIGEGPSGAVYVAITGESDWTGDTLQTFNADSAAELRFADGSTATLTGPALLTVAGGEGKVWRLRRGTLLANVAEQADAMVVHTPAADLTVLGTRFEVEADPRRTVLTVHTGRVRLTRLADGAAALVTAGRQSVASLAGRGELAVTPPATASWRSDLKADVQTGEWYSRAAAYRERLGRAVGNGRITRAEAARMFAERFPDGDRDADGVRAELVRLGDGTSYLVSLVPRRVGPVVLKGQCRFRVRGRVRSPALVRFGFTTPAGRFSAERRVAGSFDVELPLRLFRAAPGQTLTGWFAATADRAAGLEITGVGLTAPG